VQGLALQRIPDGWSLVLLAVLVVGGAQLLALGIIGEYLGRVLLTAYGKPQYSIAESIAAVPAPPPGPVA
jgi:polyisoprenyl-phosphate glycosyltransferase